MSWINWEQLTDEVLNETGMNPSTQSHKNHDLIQYNLLKLKHNKKVDMVRSLSSFFSAIIKAGGGLYLSAYDAEATQEAGACRMCLTK